MKYGFVGFVNKYNYSIPPNLIAQEPATPRDSARLLVYNRKTKVVSYSTFLNLESFLPPKAVLVFNQTKVIPARLRLSKNTGGQVKILYLGQKGGEIQVMSDKFLRTGSVLYLKNKPCFEVIEKSEKYYKLKFLFKSDYLLKLLEKYGETPIPPYLRHTLLSEKELKIKYQTIFARIPGSVAAPTASLHFTRRLLKKIKSAGFSIKFVTLDVNLGTFAPLTSKQVASQQLHSEHYSIDKSTMSFLNKAKSQGRPIIAVGTTVARTLESAAIKKGSLFKPIGDTSLFINEGYGFKFIDGLITNFHVPRSSLLMLVAAMVGQQQLFYLYDLAKKKRFKFFSFGDGMLIC